MPELSVLFLAACMMLGAALYTSVGHAGASAYIALMALFGSAPVVMRPTALALNILVAGFTSFRYLSAGLFRWRTLWPFLLGAVPFAFLGGSVQLPGAYYRPLVGAVLMLGGARLLWSRGLKSSRDPHDPAVWITPPKNNLSNRRHDCGAVVKGLVHSALSVPSRFALTRAYCLRRRYQNWPRRGPKDLEAAAARRAGAEAGRVVRFARGMLAVRVPRCVPCRWI